jgi:hypothetical protein
MLSGSRPIAESFVGQDAALGAGDVGMLTRVAVHTAWPIALTLRCVRQRVHDA